LVVTPGEGGKYVFHGSSKLSNTMPPPPPPLKENFESSNVIYCCHKKAVIGTTPDAFDIMARLQAGETGNSFGNSVFSVSFKDEDLKKPQPLFGAEYNFHLTEVVDCPEFLVHFPTLVRLAEQHGLMMIGKQRFQNFFNAKKDAQDGRMLLSRMNALETFPSRKTVGPEEQYEHVAQFKEGQEVVGTLSQDEWEALTIYTVFAFKKIR